jgi:2-polyprenyl-3-methyl-5-hydroxy-6-metoxy-1,4-benzoquinol methylase
MSTFESDEHLRDSPMSEVASIYTDGTYASRNPVFGDDTAEWKVKQALRAIQQYGIPHGSIAEVGCGAGAIIRDLAKAVNAERAVGYEPMPEAFEVARTRATEELEFFNRAVTAETKGDYDLVMCFDVIEHLEDCFTFIRHLKNLSRHLLFHIPLDMSVQMVARMRPILGVRHSVGHLHYFSKDTALATLAECGLTVRGHFYTCEGPYQGKMYRLLKWPRKLAFAAHPDLAVRFLGGYSLMVYATAD